MTSEIAGPLGSSQVQTRAGSVPVNAILHGWVFPRQDEGNTLTQYQGGEPFRLKLRTGKFAHFLPFLEQFSSHDHLAV